MQLQMKAECGRCRSALVADGQAYICAYECTFCFACATDAQYVCPNCAGELVRRPRLARYVESGETVGGDARSAVFSWPIWVVSFGVWLLVALGLAVESYVAWRSRGAPMSFGTVLGFSLGQILTYAPLTPLVFEMAMRFPIRRENWAQRSLLHLLFAVLFCVGHITLRGLTPYGQWDPRVRHYVSAVWSSQAHAFQINWHIFKVLFQSNFIEDLTGAYVPIAIIAYALSYYQKLRDREVHSAKLETLLAKSRLQALKSHLQPHFLFNTMHSISALMLTDVTAADKMMARLSDLLRMSFESSGIQITTLSRELEFVTGYLEVEKIRFGKRLNVRLEIAPETLDAQVPSLLLQPIVENAIRHGISKLTAGGSIWITASQDGRNLHLRVTDNGPGLIKAIDFPSRSGFGLRMTRERLETMYGDEQSCEIRGAMGGGVEVRVTIPFRIDDLSKDILSTDELSKPDLSKPESSENHASLPRTAKAR
jgi:two-component system, LytTR family, sensor kinase